MRRGLLGEAVVASSIDGGRVEDRTGDLSLLAAEATEDKRVTEVLSSLPPLLTDSFGMVMLVREITGSTDEKIVPAEDIRLGGFAENPK
jgi:hypothetical protein